MFSTFLLFFPARELAESPEVAIVQHESAYMLPFLVHKVTCNHMTGLYVSFQSASKLCIPSTFLFARSSKFKQQTRRPRFLNDSSS